MALALLVILAFFWPTIRTFPATWAQYGMSHGWLVAALVLWLTWRSRRRILNGGPGDSLFLVGILGLSLVWMAATIAHIQLGQQVTFTLLLVMWGLALFGQRGATEIISLGAVFFLALPLWHVLVPILRPLTSIVSGTLAKLTGIPVRIEGDLIHIQAGTFHVADGCAGLNTLLAALVVGAAYAQLIGQSRRAGLAVVALAAGIAIAGNWIRVAALILIGHATTMQSGLIEDHLWFGWVIFTIGLIPFFWIAGRLDSGHGASRSRSRHPLTAEPPRPRMLGPGRVGSASALALIGPAVIWSVGLLPERASSPASLIELAGGPSWYNTDGSERTAGWHPAYQGASQHDHFVFTNGTHYVYGDRFEFRNQQPEAKLIGYPNRIADPGEVLEDRVVGPVDPMGRRWVRQALIRTDEGAILTWYWYRVGGVEAFTAVHAKALEIPAFFGRRRVAELIALSASCGTNDCSEAVQALATYMGTPLRATSRSPAVGVDE